MMNQHGAFHSIRDHSYRVQVMGDYPITDDVLRISDASTTHQFVSQYGYVKWSHSYGDWSDASGTFLGSASFTAPISVTNTGSVKEVSIDVTTLVQAWLAGTYPNNGLMLLTTSGGSQTNFATKEAASGQPTLSLTLVDSSVAVLGAGADTYIGSGLSPLGTGTTMHTTGGEPCCLWFDLSGITQAATAATLVLTSTWQYGVTASISVVRIDLSHLMPTLTPVTGVANNYIKDSGLENDAAVIFVEQFPDLLLSTGRPTGMKWTADIPAISGFQYVVGDTDPNYPAYAPPAPGVKALKTGVQGTNDGGGGYVQLSQSWMFWNNTGSEPEEVYARFYIYLADTWDGGLLGGKLPGFFCNYNKSGNNLKPNPPAQGGNGGSPTFGFGGWSSRTGFQTAQPSAAVFAGGYRNIYFSDIYTPPDHMSDVVNANFGGYYTEGGAVNVYGALVPWTARGLLRQNQWHSVEMHVKMNSIDTSGATLANFGNTYQPSGNFAGIAMQYRSPASTPFGSDTDINSYSQVRFGNNTGYFYLDGDSTFRSNGMSGGTDTAVLTSPGVGRWDGTMECWVDGQLAFSRPNWLFRHIDSVQIQNFGLTLQHGGTEPYNPATMDLYIAQVVAATSYIGPMRTT